jgi:anti-sigma regulatory factor (Ser/Thr protein kinase)
MNASPHRSALIARGIALRMSLTYAAGATIWIVLTDWAENAIGLPGPALALVNAAKSAVFVAVTTLLLYWAARRFLTLAVVNHDRYREAQHELHARERSIQQAYVDVLASVTGGKLILMWPDEVPRYLGRPVVPETDISEPSELGEARQRIAPALAELPSGRDEALLAANEAITNALKHAGSGRYGVRRTDTSLQVVVTDHGPGIDFQTLPRATLIAGYSTKTSLGIGFTIMFDASERVLLATGSGSTTVVLEFPLDHDTSAEQAERE